MVGACQQNSVIFLVRGGEAGLGLGEMPAEAEAGLAAEPPGTRQRARSGQGPGEMPTGAEAEQAAGSERDACDQITGAGGGLGARCLRTGIGWQRDVTAADRCWRVPRLGWQWAGEMPAGAGAGLAAEPPGIGVGGSQINSKENAL